MEDLMIEKVRGVNAHACLLLSYAAQYTRWRFGKGQECGTVKVNMSARAFMNEFWRFNICSVVSNILKVSNRVTFNFKR